MNSLDPSLFLTSNYTTSEGIGGIIKQLAEDFVVGEIIDDHQILDPRSESFNLPGKKGLFLHFVLIKKDIDTSSALDWIAKLWKIQRSNFSIAGTKDKKALTAQRVSLWGAKAKFEKQLIQNVSFPTLKTKALCMKLKEVRLGNLWGNYFDIVIRNIEYPKDTISERIKDILDEIEARGGILNSFGNQRFGDKRPITHIVGKKLLQGDVKEAIRYYIGKVFDTEDENTKNARTIFWESQKPENTLKILPKHLRIERKILSELSKHKNDYLQAFNSLPIQFRKLFVHAYQSYLFNRYLQIRVQDYEIGIDKQLSGEKEQNNQIFIPIVGATTQLEGQAQEIYKIVFEEENISLEDFQKPFTKKIGGKGTFRALGLKPENVEIVEIEDDELNTGRNKVKLSFEIVKGSYATEFLREITKN